MDAEPEEGENRALPAALSDKAQAHKAEIIQAAQAATDLVDALRQWSAGDLYRVHGKPEVVLRLHPNADGSVMGFAHDDKGRFLGHARWTKATTLGSRLMASASVLAGHAMLVEISQKLDRIEGKINQVNQALSDDRRKDLTGAVKAVERALGTSPANLRGILYSTAPLLQQALEKEIQALARALEAVPFPPRWHLKGFVWDTSDEARRALEEAKASVIAVLEGIRASIHLYLALEERETAWRTAADLFEELSRTGLEEARWKARLIRPTAPDDLPEDFWARTIAVAADGRDRCLSMLENPGQGEGLLVTLSPDELLMPALLPETGGVGRAESP